MHIISTAMLAERDGDFLRALQLQRIGIEKILWLQAEEIRNPLDARASLADISGIAAESMLYLPAKAAIIEEWLAFLSPTCC